jgi:hypothetical protein
VKKYYSALTVWKGEPDIERGLFSVGGCAIFYENADSKKVEGLSC